MRQAIVLALSLAACANPPKGTVPSDPTRPQRQEPPAAPAEDERYRLEQEGQAPPADVEFEEDRLKAPEDVTGEGFDVNAPRAEDVKPAPVPATQSTPVPAKDPNAAVGYQVQLGFRVQLAALRSAVEAEDARRIAQQRLGLPVYVELEDGHYKVRAGDFTDRAQAVALQTRARGYGYPEAWIANTEVRVAKP